MSNNKKAVAPSAAAGTGRHLYQSNYQYFTGYLQRRNINYHKNY